MFICCTSKTGQKNTCLLSVKSGEHYGKILPVLKAKTWMAVSATGQIPCSLCHIFLLGNSMTQPSAASPRKSYLSEEELHSLSESKTDCHLAKKTLLECGRKCDPWATKSWNYFLMGGRWDKSQDFCCVHGNDKSYYIVFLHQHLSKMTHLLLSNCKQCLCFHLLTAMEEKHGHIYGLFFALSRFRRSVGLYVSLYLSKELWKKYFSLQTRLSLTTESW